MSGHRVRALAAFALAASLVSWWGGPAGASTKEDRARARLAALVQRIGSERAALDGLRARLRTDDSSLRTLQAELAAMAPRLGAASDGFARVEGRLMQVRGGVAVARSSYLDARGRLDEQARQAYMFGPALGLEAILGATSLADLSDRVEFVDTVSRTQAAASAAAEARSTALRSQERQLNGLLEQRASALRDLSVRREAVQAAFVAQQDLMAADRSRFHREQSLLATLDGERRQVDALVTRLATGLSPAELADAQAASAAATAAHDGRSSPMPISFGRWAGLLMPRLGAPACLNNLIVTVAWETQEYTQARWNPLATTKDMPGATDFNSTGVKDYRSLGQGLEATRLTLEDGAPEWGYQAVLESLRSCADPMATARAINASSWCLGCAGGGYVTALVPAVQAWFSSHPR